MSQNLDSGQDFSSQQDQIFSPNEQHFSDSPLLPTMQPNPYPQQQLISSQQQPLDQQDITQQSQQSQPPQNQSSLPPSPIEIENDIPPPIDQSLLQLQSPPYQFPKFSNADLNDWVIAQAETTSNPTYRSTTEMNLLRQEMNFVQDKLSQVNESLQQSSNSFDVVELFGRFINTHPSIHHITFPLPSFFNTLVNQVVKNEIASITNEIRNAESLIQTYEGVLKTLRQRANSLQEYDEDDYEHYFRKLQDSNVDTAIYDTLKNIVNTGQPQPMVFLTIQSQAATPVQIAPNTAKKMLATGLYMASGKAQLFPASRDDYEKEIHIINQRVKQCQTEQIIPLGEKVKAITNGDYSSLGADFNPFHKIDKRLLTLALKSIKGCSDLYPVVIQQHIPPKVDINGIKTESSKTYDLSIKTAALNGGFGFFFQLPPHMDPAINRPGGPTLDIGRVLCEAVFDGARTLPLPPTYNQNNEIIKLTQEQSKEAIMQQLEQIQPTSNFDNASNYIATNNNSLGMSEQPPPGTWFSSPLNDPRYKAQKQQLNSLEQYKQAMGQTITHQQPEYDFHDHAIFQIRPTNVSVESDSGATATDRNERDVEFILSILRTLTPNSTHFTIRFYFDNTRQLLQELLNTYNSMKFSSTTSNTISPFEGGAEVPLAGLYNQGVTCYLNTYLQALYGLPYLRRALFYLPLTPSNDGNSEVYTPFCTHYSQLPPQEELNDETTTTTTTTTAPLVYVTPTTLTKDIDIDEKWVPGGIGQSPTATTSTAAEDKRYVISVREHLVRNGRIGKHVKIDQIQEPDQNNITRKIKQFVYKKIIEHSVTPNTKALQSLFLKMQTSSRQYFKWIYSNQYKATLGTQPQSILDAIKNGQFGRHNICAQHTQDVTKSFLSKQFGWRQNQLHEQQDLQELARKVSDNIEMSTYNTVLEGVTQRLFKGYYENVTKAINVEFTKITEEAYEELILPVRDCQNLADSFNAYQAPEQIEGYKTDTAHGSQTVYRNQRLTDKLPPVLTLMLKRMDFDYTTFEQTKINSKVEFPPVLDMTPFVHKTARKRVEDKKLTIDEQVDEYGIDLELYDNAQNAYNTPLHPGDEDPTICPLHGDQSLIYDLYSVLVHAGNINSGHYINFIRPFRNSEHLTQPTSLNNVYAFPQNKYQATGFEDENNNDDPSVDLNQLSLDESTEQQQQQQEQSPPQSQQIQPQQPQQPTGTCTCPFEHTKAEFYRQGDWYCFDDQAVTLSTPKAAIDENYGGSQHQRFNAGKSAYLLMYIKRSYTYYDSTNQANELTFHPIVLSELGQQLLPASALPSTAIPMDKINSIVTTNEEPQLQSQEMNDMTNNDNNNNNTTTSMNDDANNQINDKNDGQTLVNDSMDNAERIFTALDNETDTVLSKLNNSKKRSELLKLSQLQQIRLQNGGFIDVYAPLPLRRVLAQISSENQHGSRWCPMVQEYYQPPQQQSQQYPQQQQFQQQQFQQYQQQPGQYQPGQYQQQFQQPYDNMPQYQSQVQSPVSPNEPEELHAGMAHIPGMFDDDQQQQQQ